MTRSWVAWVVVGTAAVILAATLVLMTLNSTLTSDPFTAVFPVVIASYLAVSAVLCSRLPSNPIGWLPLVADIAVTAPHPSAFPVGETGTW